MLAPLNTWINNELQPLAAKQLGAKIVKVEVMSDYSCRTAFGRVGNKLSEHAYVDALDIRGFVTEKGQTAHVLEAWGATEPRYRAAASPPPRPQAEKLAPAQADAAKAGARQSSRPASAGSDAKPSRRPRLPRQLGSPGAGLAKTTRADGVDKVTVTLPGGRKQPVAGAQRRAARRPRGRQAQPKAQERSRQEASERSRREGRYRQPRRARALRRRARSARFLRAAHAAACRIFGTTLGPEANEAHRNHFHVDMAERKYKKICD